MNYAGLATQIAPQVGIPKVQNPLIQQALKLLDGSIKKTKAQQGIVDTVFSVLGMPKPVAPKVDLRALQIHANQIADTQAASFSRAMKRASAEDQQLQLLTKYAEGVKSYCDKQGLDGSEIVEELFDGQILI